MRVAYVLAAIVALGSVLAIALTQAWLGARVPSGGRFDAGASASYEPGSMRYFKDPGVYLVRRPDGVFIALYDWDPRSQWRFENGQGEVESCRVEIVALDAVEYNGGLAAIRSRYPPVEGLESVLLRSHCNATGFDPLGRRAFGPVAADLDRFDVVVNAEGNIIVNLDRRTCGQGSPCLPYR